MYTIAPEQPPPPKKTGNGWHIIAAAMPTRGAGKLATRIEWTTTGSELVRSKVY